MCAAELANVYLLITVCVKLIALERIAKRKEKNSLFLLLEHPTALTR
jgi:hypothetical protein